MGGKFYIEGKPEKAIIRAVQNAVDELGKKVGSFIIYSGITTDNSAPDGSTLVCADLISQPDYDGNQVVITSGGYIGQAREISGTTTGGIITPFSPFSGQIVVATHFAILAIRTLPNEIALILDYVDELETRLTAARAGYLDRIANLTRPQKGTQTTTNILTIVGAAIEDTVSFKVSGFISLHNMLAGDTFLVIEEIRDQDDTTYREYGRNNYSDIQTSPMVWFEPKVCLGWRVRIQRTAGIDKDITYQFFKEVRSA